MDLKPNQTMLDPTFDGYKLSLDPLPMYKVSLYGGLDEVRLRDDQYSFQHVKAYGSYNYLVSDPWYDGVLYYVDNEWNIRRFIAPQGNIMEAAAAIYQLPDNIELRQRTDRLNVTMYPTSPEHMCVNDGAGNLYILHTGDRTTEQDWKVVYSGSPVSTYGSDTPVPSILLHSIHHTDHIECLLLHVTNNPQSNNDNNIPSFLTYLTWLTFISGSGEKWKVTRTRQLTGTSTPDYSIITSTADTLIVASEKPFTFVADSLHPVVNEKKETNGDLPADTGYAWTQTSEDVTVFFSLSTEISKPDIAYMLTAETLELGIKNGASLLQGAFHAAVDVSACTWTLAHDGDIKKLELHLEKRDASTWPEVIVGDTRGHLVADMEQIEEIHQQLAYLTSDQLNPDPEGPSKAYNSQQLEECDAYPDTHSALIHIHGDTHKVTHQANLSSHQWLFTRQAHSNQPPCLCLRHDVDGVVWQPVADDSPPWQHIATFNAFGYVQASKQQKKYCTCSPNFSYAVVCDILRHVYIYHQPSTIASPLRNRVTGREVSAVAKQQLISLDSVENIMGLSVKNDSLYLMAGNTLFMIRVGPQ